MPNVTLAFDESVGGWTSEFSFVPDSGVSLNNKLYTFHNGRIWEHNEDLVPRNNFYGIQHNTSIQFVFNQNPTAVKNFKTLGYEGEGIWSADLETNLEEGSASFRGVTTDIDGTNQTTYLTKEGKTYGWIQGKAAQQYENIDFASNAVQGIGNIMNTLQSGVQYSFGVVPSFLSPGDALWFVEENQATSIPKFAGNVDRIVGDEIYITQNGVPGDAPVPQAPTSGDFVFYVKDNRQEKSGIIGFYSTVTMTNTETSKAEIFSVNSDSFIQTI